MSACIVLLFVLSCDLAAQNKAAFDINDEEWEQQEQTLNQTSLRKSTGRAPDRVALANGTTAATLLPGGYFTFGTTGGRSASHLDDNCQITYGHPYALTSYVELFWDGEWKQPGGFFTEREQQLFGGTDTIRLVMTKPGVCSLEIRIHQDEASASLLLEAFLKNLDTLAHEGAVAVRIDPALGRWGDAAVLLGGVPVERDTLLPTDSAPFAILLEERAHGASAGLRASLSWPGASPETVGIENWEPAFGPTTDPFAIRPRQLFDVVLRPVWASRTLLPEETTQAGFAVTLPEPDFSSQAFMRIDLPTALSLDNGALFPREFTSMVETWNGGSAAFSNGKLSIATSSPTIVPSTALWGVSAAPSQFGYSKPAFRSTEVFENEVVAVTLRCSDHNVVIDSLIRYVYVPAVAISDTGLIVTIDTVEHASLPAITVRFGVTDEATQIPLIALRSENIRLLENGTRIRDFILGKDSRSSVNAVDIVFALDVTGSMAGEIAGVRDNVEAFANELTEKGISFRLGLVTFYDTIGEVFPLTDDVAKFQTWVAKQSANGGDDIPENSLEALHQAASMTFRPEAHRLIIWITDATYHENDIITRLTVPEVLNVLLQNAITVHAIGANEAKEEYDRIIQPTGGLFFDINGNFRDILLDISRFNVSTQYELRYSTPDPAASERSIAIDVHYAGKGGSAIWIQQGPAGLVSQARLECYPNPFNPAVTLQVSNAGVDCGWLTVVDCSGREVERFLVDGTRNDYRFVWNAGGTRSSGMYFVRLQLSGEGGALLRTGTSVLYTK